jgi:hypothetical protein
MVRLRRPSALPAAAQTRRLVPAAVVKAAKGASFALCILFVIDLLMRCVSPGQRSP